MVSVSKFVGMIVNASGVLPDWGRISYQLSVVDVCHVNIDPLPVFKGVIWTDAGISASDEML